MKRVINVKPTGGIVSPTAAEYAARVQFGTAEEQRIIGVLESVYNCTLRASSYAEDTRLDIDVWMGDVPISIKSQPIAQRTGNLCFELEVMCADTGLWEPSWYVNGAATYYVIAVVDVLYKVSKARLRAYVDAHGFEHITQLTHAVRATQQHHNHVDARVGLISIHRLLAADVMRIIE